MKKFHHLVFWAVVAVAAFYVYHMMAHHQGQSLIPGK